MNLTGKVYLVGAGPGDPVLITVRGLECLQKADLVLYDYLVNPILLEHASKAELVCLGHYHAGREFSQEEINDRMIRAAGEGKVVVRLKGGDPGVFGRGGEETAALRAAGIPYEIVPGVTAALAAATCTEIPITHGHQASAVAFVTGHQRADKTDPLDYAALATFPGTLIFYMGIRSVDRWSRALLEGGKPPETPVAIVRRCTFPDQKIVRCTLQNVAETIAKEKLRPPAVIVVGEVVDLAPAMSWFAKRPLTGQTVMATRPRGDDDVLSRQLRELGAEVLIQPVICISDPPDWRPVDDALTHLAQYDWVVFSSANGVQYFIERLLNIGGDFGQLHRAKLAAIGPATSDALLRHRLFAGVIPPEFRAESLADALAGQASGKRFLLVRASRGREILAEQLRSAGAIVEQVVAYTSSDIDKPDPDIVAKLTAGKIDWITVTSSSIARSLAALFGDKLRQSKLASISPVTSATLRELGYEPAAEAAEYTMPGLAAAIQHAK